MRAVYRSNGQESTVERDAPILSPDVERNECMAPGELLKLHVCIDHSVMEVFVSDGCTCLASRVYPLPS